MFISSDCVYFSTEHHPSFRLSKPMMSTSLLQLPPMLKIIKRRFPDVPTLVEEGWLLGFQKQLNDMRLHFNRKGHNICYTQGVHPSCEDGREGTVMTDMFSTLWRGSSWCGIRLACSFDVRVFGGLDYIFLLPADWNSWRWEYSGQKSTWPLLCQQLSLVGSLMEVILDSAFKLESRYLAGARKVTKSLYYISDHKCNEPQSVSESSGSNHDRAVQIQRFWWSPN